MPKQSTTNSKTKVAKTAAAGSTKTATGSAKTATGSAKTAAAGSAKTATGSAKTATGSAKVVTKTRKPRAPKTTSGVVAAPVEVEVEVAPVSSNSVTMDTTVVSPTEDVSLHSQFTEFLAKLQQVSSQFSSLKSEFRTLEKRWTRELKLAQKASAKKKRKAGNRQPSGFVKPTLISTELAVFLEKPEGSEMARTAVTRDINQYIRSHDLQDKDNGRKINPDGALRTLLKLKKGDELTYFNLQRYMSPHFAKAGALPVAGVSSATAAAIVALAAASTSATTSATATA